MRYHVCVIVALIGCCGQLVQSVTDTVSIKGDVCIGKEDNVTIPTGHPCVKCTCKDEAPICLSLACPKIACFKELVVYDPDQCCPICTPGCQHDIFGYMEPGSKASDEKGCLRCSCSLDSELSCTQTACMKCNGHHEEDGTCCGKCTEYYCLIGDITYKDGEEIPTKNPCETCHCRADGEHVGKECYMQGCPRCIGIWTPDETCCGKCETRTDVCLHEDVVYKENEPIPRDNPCEACYCRNYGDYLDVDCQYMLCPACVSVPDGSCCGRCAPVPIDVCIYDGVHYAVGASMPSSHPCEFCSCFMGAAGAAERMCAWMDCAPCPMGYVRQFGNGDTCCGTCVPSFPALCATVKCLMPPCSEDIQITPEDECCPQCKCRWRRRLVNPGPVGRKCSGCVCRNGKVTCTKPVCPKLECVDAIMGDDCCYYCPNGRTCMYGTRRNQIVVYPGPPQQVDTNLACMCLDNPWYPNAFCARINIPPYLETRMKNRNIVFPPEDLLLQIPPQP